MTPYYGDFIEDATVPIPFNTFAGSPPASATITNLVAGDVKVHKNGSTTEIVNDGVSVNIDFDGVTGNHLITIDTSVDTDYATGSDYLVRIEGATVDGETINAFIGSFSIENRYTGAVVSVPTVEQVRTEMDANSTQLQAIVQDTNIDLPSSISAISDTVVAILDDTNAAAPKIDDIQARSLTSAAKNSLEAGLKGNITGTVAAGSTTTSIVTAGLNLSSTDLDQLKGKVITFASDTTTAGLVAQPRVIDGNTADANPTLTIKALTSAPVVGDTFTLT